MDHYSQPETITAKDPRAAAKEYVKKLMNIQRFLIRKYPSSNHGAVVNALSKVTIGFDIYDTRKVSGMQKFWLRFREAIEYLIPSNEYPGYKKLRKEFDELDHTELWNSLSNTLK
jgi:hypothetical protein